MLDLANTDKENLEKELHNLFKNESKNEIKSGF
jgi:hypothetical protein